MKTLNLFFVLALFAFISCQKEGSQFDTAVLSEEDIAMTLESALKSTQGGMTVDLEEAAQMTGEMELTCDTSDQATTTQNSSQGNFSITANWSWSVACEGKIPEQVNFAFNGKSSGEGNTISLDSNNEGSMTVSNLVLGSDYIFKGALKRVGTTSIDAQQSRHVVRSTIDMHFDEVRVKKLAYEVTGGSASIRLRASLDGGNTIDYSGTIVFNGARSATITFDNGQTYHISL